MALGHLGTDKCIVPGCFPATGEHLVAACNLAHPWHPLPFAPAGLNPEPVRQGSELSARINAVMRQLRDRRELWQVGWLAGGHASKLYRSLRDWLLPCGQDAA